MDELVEYHQYQCDGCGFRVRSPDRIEVVAIAQRHESTKHDLDRGREAVEADLRLLELEGLPDN